MRQAVWMGVDPPCEHPAIQHFFKAQDAIFLENSNHFPAFSLLPDFGDQGDGRRNIETPAVKKLQTRNSQGKTFTACHA